MQALVSSRYLNQKSGGQAVSAACAVLETRVLRRIASVVPAISRDRKSSVQAGLLPQPVELARGPLQIEIPWGDGPPGCARCGTASLLCFCPYSYRKYIPMVYADAN